MVTEAGGAVVGPLVIGRHVTPSWEPSNDMLDWLNSRTWDETKCCRCSGEQQNPGSLPI